MSTKRTRKPTTRPVCGNCQVYLDGAGVHPGRIVGLCDMCSPPDGSEPELFDDEPTSEE
jgi:hypothetical protein